jgi:hypothetical protein
MKDQLEVKQSVWLPSVGGAMIHTAGPSNCLGLEVDQKYLFLCRSKNDFDVHAERRLEASCVTNNNKL